jgi:hypothetical protein
MDQENEGTGKWVEKWQQQAPLKQLISVGKFQAPH